MSATIKDVAQEAGVSTATVSRVFNESGRVQSDTRDRVLGAARALNYVPNESARSLIRKKTQTVGVIVPDMHGEFFAQVIRGLERTARDRDFHLLVSSSHSEASEAKAALKAMRGRVDGVVMMWPQATPDFLRDLLPGSLPVVLLNAPDSGAGLASLSFDNYGGARAAVEHLIDHGHERIAILAGPRGNMDAEQRRAGYLDALTEHGLPTDPSLQLEAGFLRQRGYEAVESLLALTPSPTALFASNDSMAVGALRGLREAGVRVPEDLAIVGFDDIPTAQYLTPPLTTVRVPMHELGARAMDVLLQDLQDGTGLSVQETLPTELIVRQSCGCAAP